MIMNTQTALDFDEPVSQVRHQVLCSDPRVVTNPKLPELLSKYRHYVVFGHDNHYTHIHRHAMDFRIGLFSPKRFGVTPDNAHECYVIDDDTGETFPMYFVVPCGHCDICKCRKQFEFVRRCKLETQCYDTLPYFVTFTYNDVNLPSDGVSVRDVQLFLKRLRRNIEYAGYSFRFRYVVVAEYGTVTHRPHYHGIFWGFPSYSTQQYLFFIDLINKSWQNGFIRSRLINAEDDKGFFYTAKYMRKDCYVPEGCNPTFMLSSRGNGGIGSHFLDFHRDDIHRNLDTSFKYKNRFNGRIENLVFSQYVLNRLFPSFSRAVHPTFRKVVSYLCAFGRVLEHRMDNVYNSCVDFFHSVESKFRDYFYVGQDAVPSFCCQPLAIVKPKIDYSVKRFNVRLKNGDIVEDFNLQLSCSGGVVTDFFGDYVKDFFDYFKNEFHKLLPRVPDMATASAGQALRERFLGKLFRGTSPISVDARAYECSRYLSWKSPSEVF